MKDAVGGGKLGTFGKGLLKSPGKLKKLESRISANPVEGIDSAVEKVMGSNVIQKADKMTEATGTKIKEAVGTLVNNKATRFIAKPVKDIAAGISKKLEDTCDVVTTIQASDCEGNVINTVNLYGCITNNDLAPIIDVILNKMQIVLWPCISQKNNVIMRFLVNHLLKWILFWFYIGLVIDFFRAVVETVFCGLIDDEYEDAGLFGKASIEMLKGTYGMCGQESLFTHPFSDGWWDPNHDANILGRNSSRCDDRFYKKKCPYNDTIKGYMTDMTLWKEEIAKPGGNDGRKGSSHMDGELCNNITMCPNSFGHGLGIDDGNAPRKYKECCEFNVKYIIGEDDEHHFPLLPAGSRAVCDLDEIMSGFEEAVKCGAEDIGKGISSGFHDVVEWGTGYETDEYKGDKACEGDYFAAIQKKAHQTYASCVNTHVTNAGCGDYFKMGVDPVSGEITKEFNTMPGRVHADNAIYQYFVDHPHEKPPNIDWYPYVPTSYTPAYNADGGVIGSCDPTSPGYENRVELCLGPFRKATIKESMFGGYECMKDIPIFDLIKLIYKVMIIIFIFLWLFKITDGTAFGRLLLFGSLGIYVIYKANKIYKSHGHNER